jgi:hypothetical protein
VFSPGRAVLLNGVHGHVMAVHDSDLIDWGGLSLTSPACTWCDLAESLTLGQLVAVGDYLIHWQSRLVTVDELTNAVAGHRRGKLLLRAALPLLSDRSESGPESELRVVVNCGGCAPLYTSRSCLLSGCCGIRSPQLTPAAE